MANTHVLIGILLSFIATYTVDASVNEYDTYNPECKRIRRPWRSLTDEEREIYISGILALRNNDGDMDLDELIAIASSAEYPYSNFKVVEKTSVDLFWHNYFLWEIESRIRNLGGKYECFGMPYWDFSFESDRTSHPFILESGLGGVGDPLNHFRVNDYSWNVPINEWWVPNNCNADGDQYPLCSLKRALNPSANISTQTQIAEIITRNMDFEDFTLKYEENTSAVLQLFTSPNDDDAVHINSYDPIWWLFQSMKHYHLSLWIDCHDYDLIDSDDLNENNEAYHEYCHHQYCTNVMHFGLDDKLLYDGDLPHRPWSYIYSNELSVRKLYQSPKWNILYDLDYDGFYTQSGVNEFCRGKLNDEWFYIDQEFVKNDDDDNWHQYSFIIVAVCLCIFAAMVMIATFLKCLKSDKIQKTHSHESEYINTVNTNNYGAVDEVYIK